MQEQFQPQLRSPTTRGVHHLALCTDDMKATIDFYVDALAVRDRHVITASGLGAVDFARAIFSELEIFSGADEALWFDMFKHGRLPPARPLVSGVDGVVT